MREFRTPGSARGTPGNRRSYLNPLPPFFEVPAINDVAIHDELVTVDVTEEVVYLADFAIGEAKVDIRDDDGAVAELLAFHTERGRGRRGGEGGAEYS